MENNNAPLDSFQQPVKVSSVKTAMKWGAIIGLASIAISLTFYFINGTLENDWKQSVLSVALIAIGYIMCVKEQRETYQNGFISFGKAYGTIMLTALFYSLITAVFTYIFMKFGDAGIMDKALEQAEEQMREKGNSEEQIEMALEMSKKMMQPGIIATMALVGTMFISAIIGLILAAIMKKDNPGTGF